MIKMRRKPEVILALSVFAMVSLASLMLTIGSAYVPFGKVVAVLVERFSGLEIQEVNSVQQLIVWNIRWQRIALAVIVGSGLAVAGACFQTIFRNQLADPFVLGISSGAALGAALSIVAHKPQWMIVFAFVGAMASLVFVYILSQRSISVRSEQNLLLAGIACGSMLNASLSTIMALNAQQIQVIIFWLMGSLTNYVDSLVPIFGIVVGGLLTALLYARDLDVMILGDDEARFLGVNVDRVKPVLLFSMSLMTGVCVSVTGIIGFVGLVVPHLIRKLGCTGHLFLLPLSAVWGAILLLLADGLTRTVPVLAGIPIGVVTALFGSPFFLYVLYKSGRRGG